MLIAAEPPKNEPPAIISAAPIGKSYDKTFTSCNDVDHVAPSVSALGAFSPLHLGIVKRFGGPEGLSPEWIEKVRPKVTLIEPPSHGSVRVVEPQQFFTYHYTPDAGYTGKDHVSYLVEVQGKRFRVVINFWVVPVVRDYPNDHRDCQDQDFNNLGRDRGGKPAYAADRPGKNAFVLNRGGF